MSTTGTSGTLSRLVPGARRQAARTWHGLALCIEAAEHQQQQDKIDGLYPGGPRGPARGTRRGRSGKANRIAGNHRSSAERSRVFLASSAPRREREQGRVGAGALRPPAGNARRILREQRKKLVVIASSALRGLAGIGQIPEVQNIASVPLPVFMRYSGRR